MAFLPVSGIASNFRDFKNNWLKAFVPGSTTTPKVMATDATGGTTVDKFELDKDGFIVTAGDALIIPYIDGRYDLWLFPTEAEADANDTVNAKRFAIDQSGSDDLVSITKVPLEEITLTDGQTTVTFTTVNVNKSDIYLTDLSGDRGRLFENTDYTITSPTVVELNNSEPAGTKCIADSDEVEIATFSESDLVRKFATLSLAIPDSRIAKDDVLNIKDRNAGTEGGGIWDAVELSTVTVSSGAPSVGNIVEATGGQTPALALVLRVGDEVIASQWGLLNDGTGITTNNTAMEAVKDYVITFAVGQRPKIIWPVGNVAYSTSPNWGHSDLTSQGVGSGSTKFTYSGSGIAWDIDPSVFDVAFRYGISHKGFLIDCGANATHGMREENTAHSKYEDVILLNGGAACLHWEQALTVLNTYKDCGSPINRFTIASNPAEALRLAASPSKLLPCTANTYINWIAEGATGTGIRLIDADVNGFIGGTAEGNAGRGVLIATTCRNNTFSNLDMEANTGQDFNDAGQGTIWNNCLATSVLGAEVSGSSVLAKVKGGFYDLLKVSSGAKGAVIEDVNVNVKGTGSFTDAGTDTVKRNIYDKDAEAFLTTGLKSARASITVGASPFTYTNATNQMQQVLIRSGTVSLVQWGRNGDVAVVGAGGEGANFNDQFMLAPDDTLEVTYSIIPVMNSIPMGVVSL